MEEILNKFQGLKGRGVRYQAVCPAHDDDTPSLSITVGNDGRILLFCHAGCNTLDVMQEVGLKWVDLFPKD